MDKRPDDLEGMPSLMLGKDEVQVRTAGYFTEKKNRVVEEKHSFGVFGWVISFVVMGLIASVGFIYDQSLAYREATQVQLKQYDSQVDVLEHQLSDQDKTLIESGGDVDKQLALINSEIHKLWTLSNKRNKKAITENKQAVSRVSDEVAALSKKANQLAVSVAKNEKLGASVKTRVAVVEEKVKGVSQLESELLVIDKNLKRIAASSARSELKALTRQTKELEESIDAINAHRAQINRAIEKLRLAVLRLNAAAPPGSISQ